MQCWHTVRCHTKQRASSACTTVAAALLLKLLVLLCQIKETTAVPSKQASQPGTLLLQLLNPRAVPS